MMFGNYVLYAKRKTIGFICNELLYIKMLPESEALKERCEVGEPYPGAKPYYVVAEDQLDTMEYLVSILLAIADSLPEKK